MKSVSTLALGLALALAGGATVVTPAAAAEKKPAPAKQNFSPKVVANDKAVRAALTAKDWAAAKTAIAASEAEIKSDDDKMLVGNYYIQVGQEAQDQAALGKGIDLYVASGKVPPDQRAKIYAAQGKIAYQAKDYDKAITALTGARDSGSDDPDLYPVLVQSLVEKGRTLEGLQTLNAGIDATLKAGKPVPHDWYARGFTIAYQTKPAAPDYAAIRAAGNQINMKWLRAEPSGTTWHDVLLTYAEAHPNDNELANDIRRLLYQTGGLKTANDYLEYAEGTYQKYPGEAKMVLDEGVKKGAFTLAGNRSAAEINGIVAPKVTADKASLPGTEAKARAAADGKLALITADAYLGYGNNAKAVELYKLALSKGGTDANVVNTRLGIALARAGDKPGAKAAFALVTGARKDLADFWTLYVDQGPAAA